VWDVGTGRRLGTFRAPVPLADTQLDSTGSLLAAVGDDGAARVWPVRGNAKPAVLPNARWGRVVEFSADGGTLLVAGGYRARLFDVRSHRAIATLPAGGRVVDASFGAGDRLVVTATGRGRVRVWHRDGTLVRTIDTHTGRIAAVAVSPDGTIVGTAGADGVARTWSVRRGRPRHVLHILGGAVTDVEFSGDGRYVIAAGEREARVWTVEDGVLVHVLRGHHGLVASVAFSPDDRWILTSGPTAVGLWNTATGHLLFYLRGGRAQVEKAVFSPDDEHVLAGSADGSVRVYDCQVCGTVYQLARLARARLNHVAIRLTPEARGRYFGG